MAINVGRNYHPEGLALNRSSRNPLGDILYQGMYTVHHRTISLDANPARGYKKVPRSTGHIMVTAPATQTNGRSKSRQKTCQVQPTENIRNCSASRRCLRGLLNYSFYCCSLSGVLLVFQNLNYKLQRILSHVLPIQRSNQITSNGTD